MEFTLNNADATSASLLVKVEQADYEAKVEKSLKTFKQKANIPGFRPGMVPMGLIKKQYGTSVKVEEINKLLQEKTFEYIRENNIDMLGEPLPNEEKQIELDFVNGVDFEFEFLIALAPKFDASLSTSDKLTYYNIQATEEMVDEQIKAYAQRCGDYQKIEEYTSGDMIKGTLCEDGENGICIEDSVLMPSYMKDEQQNALFDGKKVGDSITFNPFVAFDGNEAEISSLLKITKEEVSSKNKDFTITINEVTRFVASEINQKVFDTAFGEGVVNSEEEFRARIKSDVEKKFIIESDYKLLMDVRTYLMARIGKLEYAEPLLKRIMMANNPEKDENYVAEYFEKSIAELSWHLIKEQLTKQFEVKLDEGDVLAAAKEATRDQFAQYGMANVPDELLENYAREMLKKEKTQEALINRAVDVKLIERIKEAVTLENKEIPVEEFNKMFSSND